MIPTIAQEAASQPTFESVLGTTMSSITGRLALYLNILAFVSEATEIASFDDPAYLARKSELLAALIGVRDGVDVLSAATEEANQAASDAGTGIATAVIASAKALSGPVQVTSVDTPPQSLQVIALITNVSDTPISGLEAVMPLLDEELGLSFQSPQRVSLPTLAAGASAPASWFLTFDPPGSPAALPLQVRLEVTPEDAAFIPGSFHIFLPVVGVEDSDDDGMPDDYEATFGLGVNQVSGGDDEDNDGLTNYSEYLMGTLPDDSDTDDDGATDGAEVAAGSDPEDADSTPDSVARETGDVTKDGAVNIRDVVFLLRYLSGEGPPPFPLLLGDVNGDGEVDINDVTLLLNQTAQQP